MIQWYFNRKQLENSKVALGKEFLITGEKSIYATSSITGCNQRKYHGLFITAQPQLDDEDHVLLSSVDETVTINGKSYNLAMHQYPGIEVPQGHQYLQEFLFNPMPKWLFKIEDVWLSKELLLPQHEESVMVKYQIQESTAQVNLSLNPLLAFRNVHSLRKAGTEVCKKLSIHENEIKMKPNSGYRDLFLAVSSKSIFEHKPDWYYNIEYPIEKIRGYAYQEDLYSPRQFKISLKAGESIILYAGLKEVLSKKLKAHFNYVQRKGQELNNMQQCMSHATSQFIIKKNDKVQIRAGYPWFGYWGRDTFISLPGLTLVPGHVKTFKEIVASVLPDMKKGLLPNTGSGRKASYNAVDTSLWFIWAIQQYAIYTQRIDKIWKEYGLQMRSVLEHYAKGTLFNIKMDEDGLIKCGSKELPLTWMDCIIDGVAVTPRSGKAVEINALWYNAVCFCLEAAAACDDDKFIAQWKNVPEKIKLSFEHSFLKPGCDYLADYIDSDQADWSIRPNQIIALSLPYSPVSGNIRKSILKIVQQKLLTPKGLRTLAQDDPAYHGSYYGDQITRDKAYHQGTVWPWLLAHFAEAWLKEYDMDGLVFIEELYEGFENALQELCLYTIPELYDGDPPHKPGGAFAQAWSVAELARMEYLIKNYKLKYHNHHTIKATTL